MNTALLAVYKVNMYVPSTSPYHIHFPFTNFHKHSHTEKHLLSQWLLLGMKINYCSIWRSLYLSKWILHRNNYILLKFVIRELRWFQLHASWLVFNILNLMFLEQNTQHHNCHTWPWRETRREAIVGFILTLDQPACIISRWPNPRWPNQRWSKSKMAESKMAKFKRTHCFWTHKFFGPKFFFRPKFLTPNYFYPNFFSEPIFFSNPTFYLNTIYFGN